MTTASTGGGGGWCCCCCRCKKIEDDEGDVGSTVVILEMRVGLLSLRRAARRKPPLLRSPTFSNLLTTRGLALPTLSQLAHFPAAAASSIVDEEEEELLLAKPNALS